MRPLSLLDFTMVVLWYNNGTVQYTPSLALELVLYCITISPSPDISYCTGLCTFNSIILVLTVQSGRVGIILLLFFCFRSKRVDRCVGVELEEYLEAVHRTWGPYPPGLPLTSLCDLPLLFVYFQMNNGVFYFLGYEDIYIMALSVSFQCSDFVVTAYQVCNSILLLPCLMMYFFVFALFLVSLHGDSCKCTV